MASLTAPQIRMLDRLRRFAREHMEECSGVDVDAAHGMVWLSTTGTVYVAYGTTRRRIVGPLSADYRYLRSAVERLYDEM